MILFFAADFLGFPLALPLAFAFLLVCCGWAGPFSLCEVPSEVAAVAAPAEAVAVVVFAALLRFLGAEAASGLTSGSRSLDLGGCDGGDREGGFSKVTVTGRFLSSSANFCPAQGRCRQSKRTRQRPARGGKRAGQGGGLISRCLSRYTTNYESLSRRSTALTPSGDTSNI